MGQDQLTQAPGGHVYDIDDVKFDGFNEGVLLEAEEAGDEKSLDQALEGFQSSSRPLPERARRA
ncbi:hypothetical protein D7V97_13815 [Corallococcus sp. CA053C]|nr:hypothetical protein D7V97_13815 [Corallococcus sp. CA053C]